MSSNWNFREILDLQPESDSFECVGTKTSDDSKCFNKRPLLSDLDLSKASKILDIMDECDSIKSSFEYLDDLARLSLCVVHSDSNVEQITSRWRNRIIHHMKKEVSPSPVRPVTRRRSIGKARGDSQSLMAVLSKSTDKTTPESILSGRTASVTEATRRPHPTRTLSTKISSLISEVGFHDAVNVKYTPEEPLKALPVVPARPASRIPKRIVSRAAEEKVVATRGSKKGKKTVSRTPVTPAKTTSREDQWASDQLSTLLTRPHPLLSSKQVTQKDIEDGLAAFVTADMSTRPRGLTSDTMQGAPPTPRSYFRSRSGTTSSNDSNSTARSKNSSANSASGSSPASSVNPSPAMKPTIVDNGDLKPISLSAPVLKRAATVSGSPEHLPLPKFDFGIFSNLPLPPGHKRSISEQNKRLSLTSESLSVFELDPGYKPVAKAAELDPSWKAFPKMMVEKPSTEGLNTARPGSAKPLLPRRSSDRLRVATSLTTNLQEPSAEKAQTLRPSTAAYNVVSPIEESTDEQSWLETEISPELVQSEYQPSPLRFSKQKALLPEHDSIGPIRTSWIVSPLSRPTSRRMSRSRSFSLSRTPSRRSSLSESPMPSRSASPAPSMPTSSRTVARAPSLLSRTLSRTLSRSRSTSKSSTDEVERPRGQRRATDIPQPSQQATSASDAVPLHKLIAMSHELSLRLDGHETYGQVEVRPSTSYKYRLPRASAPPAPETRMSRLFIGLDLDVTTQEKFSRLDFQIPRKAVASSPREHHEVMDRPRGRTLDIAPRPAPRTHSLGSRTDIYADVPADREAWPLMEDDTEYCGVCGGTHGLVWKCGRKLERVVTNTKPARKSTKKERVQPRVRRGSTMKRIRQRVVRALTV